MIVPYWVFVWLAVLAKPFDRWLSDTFTSEGIKSIAGVTYLLDSSKTKRELGFTARPIREAWAETVRHEMKLLGMQ